MQKTDAEIVDNLKEYSAAQLFIVSTVANSSELEKGMYWGYSNAKAYKEIMKDKDAVKELNEMVANGSLLLQELPDKDGKKICYVELTSINVLLNLLSSVKPGAYAVLQALYNSINDRIYQNEDKFKKYIAKQIKTHSVLPEEIPVVLSSSNISEKAKVDVNGQTQDIPAFIVTPTIALRLLEGQASTFEPYQVTNKNNGIYGVLKR